MIKGLPRNKAQAMLTQMERVLGAQMAELAESSEEEKKEEQNFE